MKKITVKVVCWERFCEDSFRVSEEEYTKLLGRYREALEAAFPENEIEVYADRDVHETNVSTHGREDVEEFLLVDHVLETTFHEWNEGLGT